MRTQLSLPKACRPKLLAALMAGLLVTGGALAASATYTFNYPAISHPTEHTPVAWLTLTDVPSDGVNFVFTPNWAALDSGVRFDELDLAYRGTTTPTPVMTWLDGATFLPSHPWQFDTSNHAGYDADVRFLMIHWDNTDQAHHFDAPQTSSWNFSGMSVADFTGTFASGFPNRDITPVYGIVSLQGLPGDSQNWVAGVAAIPEPQTYMLMLAGLGAMAYMARRRTQR